MKNIYTAAFLALSLTNTFAMDQECSNVSRDNRRALTYLEGKGVKQDVYKAIELSKEGAECGYLAPQMMYAGLMDGGVLR